MTKQSLSTVSSALALLALAATQACAAATQPSGDEERTAGGQTSATSSAAGNGSSSGGSSSSSGGPTQSGNSNGGASTSTSGGAAGSNGTSTSGGASTSSAGASTSVGGSGAGGAGTSSSAGASAGSTATTPFGQVQSLLAKRCSGSKCHSSGSTNLAFATATGSALHSLLTSPIPSTIPHCVGVTLVTPNNTSSPLVEVVMSGGKIACTKPKTESIGPMPDKCTTTSNTLTGVCLTTAEIAVITDWISAGAPD